MSIFYINMCASQKGAINATYFATYNFLNRLISLLDAIARDPPEGVVIPHLIFSLSATVSRRHHKKESSPHSSYFP